MNAKKLRQWFLNLFKKTPQAREIATKQAVKALMPLSWFTKKRTFGREANMRDALMDMTTTQRALAMQLWPVGYTLKGEQWAQHLREVDELRKKK